MLAIVKQLFDFGKYISASRAHRYFAWGCFRYFESGLLQEHRCTADSASKTRVNALAV
jgi:hypothetical protein